MRWAGLTVSLPRGWAARADSESACTSRAPERWLNLPPQKAECASWGPRGKEPLGCFDASYANSEPAVDRFESWRASVGTVSGAAGGIFLSKRHSAAVPPGRNAPATCGLACRRWAPGTGHTRMARPAATRAM